MRNTARVRKNEYVWILMTNDNNNETYEVAKILSIDRNSVEVKLMDYNTYQSINKNAISSNSVKYMKQMLDMNNLSKTKNNALEALKKNLDNIKKLLKQGVQSPPRSTPMPPPPPPPPPRSTPMPPPPPPPPRITNKPPPRSTLQPQRTPLVSSGGMGNLAQIVAKRARNRMERRKAEGFNF